MSDPKAPDVHPDDDAPAWLTELYEEDQPNSPQVLDQQILHAAAQANQEPKSRRNARSWWASGLASAAAVLFAVGVLLSGQVDEASLQPGASDTLLMKERSDTRVEPARQRTLRIKQDAPAALAPPLNEGELQDPAPEAPLSTVGAMRSDARVGAEAKAELDMPLEDTLERDVASPSAFTAPRFLSNKPTLPGCDGVAKGLCTMDGRRAAVHPHCADPYALPDTAQDAAELYGGVTYRVDEVWFELDCRGGAWQATQISDEP